MYLGPWPSNLILVAVKSGLHRAEQAGTFHAAEGRSSQRTSATKLKEEKGLRCERR